MSDNTSSESYRIHFSMRNPQQVREFQFLASMDIKDRQAFLHLAVSSLAGRLGYVVPENGFMGMVTALVNSPSQYPSAFPSPLPPLMSSEELAEKRKNASRGKPERKKQKKQKDDTEVNAPTEITEDEGSDVADAIMASLMLFDTDI